MKIWPFSKKEPEVPAVLSLLAPVETFKLGETDEERYVFWHRLHLWLDNPQTKQFFAIQQKELLRLFNLLTELQLEQAHLAPTISAQLKQQDAILQFSGIVAKNLIFYRKRTQANVAG